MTVKNIKLSPVDMEARKKLAFNAGDTVRVWSKIIDEKGKSRLQAFEGIVLARKHGTEIGATFTVRRIASGVGVERIFPLYSPRIAKIELSKKGDVRRAKLYYLRSREGKSARVRELRGGQALVQADKKRQVEEDKATATQKAADAAAANPA